MELRSDDLARIHKALRMRATIFEDEAKTSRLLGMSNTALEKEDEARACLRLMARLSKEGQS